MSTTTAAGTDELHTEDEALSVLLDADIDKVMAGLDRIVEAAPSYEKLFMRWQRQHWSTEDFDFSEDARQWADPDLITDEEREFLLFGFSQFFLGEERVTVELLPFAMGAPSHEAQAFLTTQISDEAKHMVFFDRFYREVLGASAATIGDMLERSGTNVNEDWERLFNGILHDCAERLRKDPSDFAALVRGITVYMVVIEGTLALTGARFIIRSLKERGWFPGFTAGLHGGEPRRVAARRVRGQVPRRRDPGGSGERPDHRGHAQGDPAGRDARVRAPGRGGPVRLRDALLPLAGDLRVRDEGPVQEAGGHGARPGDAGRRGLSAAAAAKPRPGRPSTGARERILEAGLEVLKADAYAGLTVAKVAARAGENKALIAYHFGSKQGLVAAAGRMLGEQITTAVTEAVGDASTIEGVVRGALDGIWDLMDRDVRVARVYFDLSAVSVVEDEVRDVMNAERTRWREVLLELLGEADPALRRPKAEGLAVLISAGIGGLALERVEAGDTRALGRARELFVRSVVAAAGT